MELTPIIKIIIASWCVLLVYAAIISVIARRLSKEAKSHAKYKQFYNQAPKYKQYK